MNDNITLCKVHFTQYISLVERNCIYRKCLRKSDTLTPLTALLSRMPGYAATVSLRRGNPHSITWHISPVYRFINMIYISIEVLSNILHSWISYS